MPIRVLRVIEYIFEDVEAMDGHTSHMLHGKHKFGKTMTMSSVLLPLEIMAPEGEVQEH